MKNHSNVLRLLIILLLFSIANLNGEENKFQYRIITDPKPTMKEAHYTELVKIGEIADEIEKDKFLFYPLDIASDSSGALYIYDRYQTSIIKLDKNLKYITSIGRYGFGPGEIISKGRGAMVFIDIGIDNRLYVNDMMGFKVSVFQLDGTFLHHYKYKSMKFAKPTVDKNGNIILYSWKDHILRFHNEKDETFFELPFGGEKSKIDFLYHKNTRPKNPKIIRERRKNWFPLSPFEIFTHMMADSSFLFYLSQSATMYVIKQGKLERLIKIWPEQALVNFKNEIESNANKDNHRVFMMFYRMFHDGDAEDILYFHHGNVKSKGKNFLYKLNTKGELLDVLYVKIVEGAPFVNFRVKKNGLYYARYDEKIAIYKEVGK